MALSSIQGQTKLGTTSPSGLTAAIPIQITPPAGVPAGYGVEVMGRNPNVQQGTYAIVFGYTMPAGKVLDGANSGSWIKQGTQNYDMMKMTLTDDPNQRTGNTVYYEVWFTETDVNGNDWGTEVDFITSGGTYTYTLNKRRTGGEL